MCPARFLIPVFPTDADDGVPDIVEDHFLPNQEAYFTTTQADKVLTPTLVQHTLVPRVARGRPVVPQARRNPQPSGPDGWGRRRRRNRKAMLATIEASPFCWSMQFRAVKWEATCVNTSFSQFWWAGWLCHSMSARLLAYGLGTRYKRY